MTAKHSPQMDQEYARKTFPVGAWTYVAFTYSPNSGILQLYRNGLAGASGSLPTSPAPTLAATCDTLAVGPKESETAEGAAVELRLDELKVSRVARTAEEIARSAYRRVKRACAPSAAEAGSKVRLATFEPSCFDRDGKPCLRTASRGLDPGLGQGSSRMMNQSPHSWFCPLTVSKTWTDATKSPSSSRPRPETWSRTTTSSRVAPKS